MTRVMLPALALPLMLAVNDGAQAPAVPSGARGGFCVCGGVVVK